jgi:hypothetical protein
MKLVIPAAVMLCIMSCSSFQYGKISSYLPNEPDGAANFENDTVRISYSFRGENCPVTVRVYNKTTHPLVVHWDKSSVILNGQTFPFFENAGRLLATSESTTIRGAFGNSSSGSIQGVIRNAEPSSFVPPSSFVESKIELDSLTSVRKIMQPDRDGSGSKRIYAAEYDESNSPLTFRTYISYSMHEDPALYHVENSFWLSTVTHTMARPNELASYRSRYDTFFARKPNYSGLIVGAAVGVVATAILVDEGFDQVESMGK